MIPAYSGQIPICLRCGDRNIRPQGIREGLWPGGGEGIASVCDECGHIGPPLLVDPPDTEPTAQDNAWLKEYESTAQRLDGPTPWEEKRQARGTRNQGILFLLLAALFFLPPVMVLTNVAMTGQTELIPSVLGQSWIFLGIATVALVLGVRKVELAAKIDAEEPLESPLSDLQQAVEQDQDRQR